MELELKLAAIESRQVLVFRSDIDQVQQAKRVCTALMKWEEVYQVHIDLEDWENVLRIECGPGLTTEHIREQLAGMGFKCSELDDICP